jgi:SAM-dependent methyltransferase
MKTIGYGQRWREIIERRRSQMDAAYARAGIDSTDYWARRAKAYRQALHQRIEEDPFLLRVRAEVTVATSVLDVGAGTGRHTLALAPHVGHITAVDPSGAMLSFLRDEALEKGLTNVDILESEWQQADVAQADVAICSHVLYPIADVVAFVRKLERSARARVFVYHRIDLLPTDMGLWSEFHGEPLENQPSAMDLLNVLWQEGIFPDVQVVNHRITLTYASLDDAVREVRNSVCLRDDDHAAEAKLRRLLEQRLVAWPEGRVGPEMRSTRSAILSWAPTG